MSTGATATQRRPTRCDAVPAVNFPQIFNCPVNGNGCLRSGVRVCVCATCVCDDDDRLGHVWLAGSGWPVWPVWPTLTRGLFVRHAHTTYANYTHAGRRRRRADTLQRARTQTLAHMQTNA